MEQKEITTNSTDDTEKKGENEDSPKIKNRNRGKKRKRIDSNSSTDLEDILPENTLEVEKSLHASALKNNLDDASVKKILKKVVTNDHVLALVKLREEEEESSTDESNHVPKLTRSKVKELKKVSTGSTWNLQNLELTPIKHIPVKTRPEVKALIAQELPDDEDDDEYKPTSEDVPSDDDQTLESISDVDSQPRTPATPQQPQHSPKVVKDGPFKVPQDITPARRKLELDKEEATIALRTRSKLSLSGTPIEHIESSFVPPDDLPMPAVDDLWNQFLAECLNPASTSKHEDDDETDPEYNVAADPDAPDDEDEEALEKSIIKISKKELNDLVTELFNIMPEVSGENLADNIPESIDNNVLKPTPEVQNHWEGKQEPVSDDDNAPRKKISDRLVFERRNSQTRFSIGKNEPEEIPEHQENRTQQEPPNPQITNVAGNATGTVILAPAGVIIKPLSILNIAVQEKVVYVEPPPKIAPKPPGPLQRVQPAPAVVQLIVSEGPIVLPEQQLILQQQLRQHIQLATSNFMQLVVHPVHWTYANTFKQFLETLIKQSKMRTDSIVNVCNLKPAMELITSWEKSVTENTEANVEYVNFIQMDADKCRRRMANNNFYIGDFHDMFKRVIANSRVFLYPYLLPPLPYRGFPLRRVSYLLPEDHLIVLGLDQFWQYVEMNPSLYPLPAKPHPRRRFGLTATVELVTQHMFPFLNAKMLQSHISHARRGRAVYKKENPIIKFFANREITPVDHKLLPFNPNMTLYDHPEEEIPHLWLRYLSKTSKSTRFNTYMKRRVGVTGQAPNGMAIKVGIKPTEKQPLPNAFTKKIVCKKSKTSQPTETNEEQTVTTNLYRLEQTSTGPCFVPIAINDKGLVPATSVQVTLVQSSAVTTVNTSISTSINTSDTLMNTTTVNSTRTPITSTKQTQYITLNPMSVKEKSIVHCKCCEFLQRIRKNCHRQTTITEFFKKEIPKRLCYCNDIKFPKITSRLKLLIIMYKDPWMYAMETLKSRLMHAKQEARLDVINKNRVRKKEPLEEMDMSWKDLAFVIAFRIKLAVRLEQCSKKTRKNINKIFINFDLDTGDAVQLTQELYKLCNVLEVQHDFLGFLTAEQATRCGKFADYFIQTCLVDLVEILEKEVTCNERRSAILSQLNKSVTARSAPCEFCMSLLPTMYNYPHLALRIFSLFPHLTIPDIHNDINLIVNIKVDEEEQMEQDEEQEMQTEDDANEAEPQTAADYEADHSSSGEDDDAESAREQEVAKAQIVVAKNNHDEASHESEVAEQEREVAEQEKEEVEQECEEAGQESEMAEQESEKAEQKSEEAEQESEEAEQESEEAEQESEEAEQESEEAEQESEEAEQESEEAEQESEEAGQESQVVQQENEEAKQNCEVASHDNNKAKQNLEVASYESEEAKQKLEVPSHKIETIQKREMASHECEMEKPEDTNMDIAEQQNIVPVPPVVTAQTHDDSESSDASMVIASDSDDDSIKSERQEWIRNEDKLILEIIKDYLAPEERMDKTILEILDEKQVYQLLSESLSHKSVDDIRQRVIYLLQMLLLSE